VTTLSWATLSFLGADAFSYLQGQLSQDLSGDRTIGAWTLLLAPDGAVVASGWIRGAGDSWQLLVPAERADLAEQRCRRYLLRVDCQLTRSEGATSAPLASWDEIVEQRRAWSNEFALDLAPHVFGRSFVDESVSFSKGCFTGQELVGRMDARGASMPWRLVYWRAPSVEQANVLLESTGPAGPKGVTTYLANKESWHGLGVAHRSLLGAANAEVDHVLVEEVV